MKIKPLWNMSKNLKYLSWLSENKQNTSIVKLPIEFEIYYKHPPTGSHFIIDMVSTQSYRSSFLSSSQDFNLFWGSFYTFTFLKGTYLTQPLTTLMNLKIVFPFNTFQNWTDIRKKQNNTYRGFSKQIIWLANESILYFYKQFRLNSTSPIKAKSKSKFFNRKKFQRFNRKNRLFRRFHSRTIRKNYNYKYFNKVGKSQKLKNNRYLNPPTRSILPDTNQLLNKLSTGVYEYQYLFNEQLKVYKNQPTFKITNYTQNIKTFWLCSLTSKLTLLLITTPFLFKKYLWLMNQKNIMEHLKKNLYIHTCKKQITPTILTSNVIPHPSFQFRYFKKVLSFSNTNTFKPWLTEWYRISLLNYIEYLTGRRVLFQFYPFMAQEVPTDYVVRYKSWLPRMAYYERKLGHRFFLEEAVHLLHLGFSLRDPDIIASWLRSMIMRISFWKTRSIFRFLKYLLNNYFIALFNELDVKGLKIKLKGKISAAGNSRKRTILYRAGSTSHSTVDTRVLHEFKTISTFTGVMGFQIWLFY